MRETKYAREIVTVDLDGCRIERLFVKALNREEIRFSWWKDGKMAMRPLDLSEEELLTLMRMAMREGVFSSEFLRDLRAALHEDEPGGSPA